MTFMKLKTLTDVGTNRDINFLIVIMLELSFFQLYSVALILFGTRIMDKWIMYSVE